jgi:predicted DNA-binding transcriptional regulator AlpA
MRGDFVEGGVKDRFFCVVDSEFLSIPEGKLSDSRFVPVLPLGAGRCKCSQPHSIEERVMQQLQREVFMTAPALLDRYKISESTLVRLVRDERKGFPKPIKLSQKLLFRTDEILKWEEQRRVG